MWKAGAEQIPKLTVRVRFPSLAPTTKGQVGSNKLISGFLTVRYGIPFEAQFDQVVPVGRQFPGRAMLEVLVRDDKGPTWFQIRCGAKLAAVLTAMTRWGGGGATKDFMATATSSRWYVMNCAYCQHGVAGSVSRRDD
jgi:hypothetical protein